MPRKPSAKAAPESVRVRLIAPHRHAGQDYPPGAEITLRPTQAERLAAAKIAEVLSDDD